MTRISIGEPDSNALKSRNLFTARLYGIDTNISTTRIMSTIKHTGAKFCYIPKNSATNKKRRFAVVEFASKTELKKATQTCIILSNRKLTWSTREDALLNKHHYNNIPKSDNTPNSPYLSMSEDSEPIPNIQPNKSSRFNSRNKKTIERSYSKTNNYKQIDSEESDLEKDYSTSNNKRNLRKNKINKSHDNTILNSLSTLTNQLKAISDRLMNLESSYKTNVKKSQLQKLANRS